MHRYDVRTAEDALLYLTDCTLATVEGMAMRKSRNKREYERQKSMAQISIDWMRMLRIDMVGTRAEGVLAIGCVSKWATQYEPKQG